ncbi:hypothetical protein BLA29_012102 [Euroglyphus maynei]|uniref:Uncharacterized protein n=1 Tax=Euroglyphus maynei TaxID=6958 RepID=A0A1Y3BNU0_EURMA|nr:hypothetical protein BLA29_012102 [Euroglyphus maynei]
MQPKQGLLIAENSTISDEQLDQIIHRNESIEDYYHIEREVFARQMLVMENDGKGKVLFGLIK